MVTDKADNKKVKKDQIGKKPDEILFDVNNFPGGLKSVLEAIFIAVADPQDPKKLANILGVSVEKILKTLEELKVEYETNQRGFVLSSLDGLWKFYSAPDYSEIIMHYIRGNSSQKLSLPALETLAIIAYKQPITRSEIASIRGVNVDGVVRTLLQRDLIKPAIANKKAKMKQAQNSLEEDTIATKYETTSLFLEKLGISSLDELEPLAPFLPNTVDDIDEFEDTRKVNRGSKNDSSELDDN